MTKKRLRHIYYMSKYLGDKARMRSNDLSRDPELRAKDSGIADAYDNIIFFLQKEEILDKTNFAEVNNVHIELPNWLKE